MWHASVAARFSLVTVNNTASLFAEAEHAIAGCGDATLGEWREIGNKAAHIRRRLTAKESAYAGITAVCDVRGTEEFSRRIRLIRPFLPSQLATMRDEALP